jgi:hypothetical protein
LVSLFYQGCAAGKNISFLMTKQTLLVSVFNFPVCLCSEKQLEVVLLEARASTQHRTAFCPLKFCSRFFVVTEHQ